MSDSTQRKTGAILSYASIFISILIQVLYTPLLIRMLGQSEYGLYSLVYSIIGYLTVLDFGFGNAIIVYTAKYRAKKEYEKEKKLHGMFFLIFSIIGLVAGALGICLYFNVENFFGATMSSIEIQKAKIMMLILSFNLLFTFMFNIYNSIISAYEKFIFQKILTIVSSILKPALMIPLLFFGFKSIALCVVITIVNIIIMLSNYLYCKKKLNVNVKFRGFDKKIFKTIFSYSFFIFLTIIVDKLNWSVDQVILGAISGTAAVSIYSVASTINNMFLNLSTVITGVMLPKVTKMIANKATSKQITDEFVKIGRLQFIIIFLITTGFVFIGKEFIILWAGESYISSYYVALCLIVPALLSLIQNLGLSIMQAMNKFKFKAISTFIMAIINIFISIFLAKRYGPIGAALGTTISIVVCNVIVMNIYYYFVIKINVIKFWKNIFIMFIKYIPSIIILLLIMKYTTLEGVLSILLYGGIYTLLYLISTYLFVMNKYEKNLINSVYNKIKKGVVKK